MTNTTIPFPPHVRTVKQTEGDTFVKECYDEFHELMQLRERLEEAVEERTELEHRLVLARGEELRLRERFRDAKLSMGRKVEVER
jgi:hypothetical protein